MSTKCPSIGASIKYLQENRIRKFVAPCTYIHRLCAFFYCWVCLLCSSLGFIFASFSFINTPWVFVSLNFNLLARWYSSSSLTTATTTKKLFRFETKPKKEQLRTKEKKKKHPGGLLKMCLTLFYFLFCRIVSYNRNANIGFASFLQNLALFLMASRSMWTVHLLQNLYNFCSA